MIATVYDPRTEPVPAEWNGLVDRERLHSFWRSELLTTAAWHSQTPTYLAMVAERSSDRPIAIFHVRYLALPGNPRRYHRSRPTIGGLAECRVYPHSSLPGAAFAADATAADRRAAFAAFEKALRRRLRPRLTGIAYRQLTRDELDLVPRTGRVKLAVQPSMTLDNQWSDAGSYLASLPTKWRSQLRKLSTSVRSDPSITVTVRDSIPVEQASWLIDVVRRRHTRRGFIMPPVANAYLRQLIGQPDTRFVTYEDADGRLMSFAALHDNGDEMLATYWGTRDAADGGLSDVYFDQYLQGVEYMIANGRRRLVMGKGMTDIKARYGCRPEPIWLVAGLW